MAPRLWLHAKWLPFLVAAWAVVGETAIHIVGGFNVDGLLLQIWMLLTAYWMVEYRRERYDREAADKALAHISNEMLRIVRKSKERNEHR